MERAIKFIQPAIVAIKNQHVAVAIPGLRIAFNGSICRNRHGAGIAFISIGREVDIRERGRADDNVGNANGRALIKARAKIGMHGDVTADEVDDGIGIGIERSAGDVQVPCIVGRKRNESVDYTAQAHAAARSALGIELARQNGESEDKGEGTSHEGLHGGGIRVTLEKLPTAICEWLTR